MQTIFIGSDHRGFELKKEIVRSLEESGEAREYEIIDEGANEIDETDDYVDYAIKVSRNVVHDIYKNHNYNTRGILICGSGIGMTIAANKIKGAIAADINSIDDAELDRHEHDSNILVLGADEVKSSEEAISIVKVWLKADFAKGRHLRRMNKIRYYDNFRDAPLPIIAPDILARNISDLLNTFEKVKDLSQIFHIDLLGSSFFENPEDSESTELTFEDIYSFLTKMSEEYPLKLFNIHLMVHKPMEFLERLNNLKNVYAVYVHQESDLSGISDDGIGMDREWSFSLGISLNPQTSTEKIDFGKFDILQVMTVKPGGQGREFIPDALDKVSEMREKGFDLPVHLDGSINIDTISQIVSVNPELVSVGSAIVKSDNPTAAYSQILNKIKELE